MRMVSSFPRTHGFVRSTSRDGSNLITDLTRIKKLGRGQSGERINLTNTNPASPLAGLKYTNPGIILQLNICSNGRVGDQRGRAGFVLV